MKKIISLLSALSFIGISVILINLHMQIEDGYQDERAFKSEMKFVEEGRDKEIVDFTQHKRDKFTYNASNDVPNIHNLVTDYIDFDIKNNVKSAIKSEFKISDEKAEKFSNWIVNAYDMYSDNIKLIDIMAIVGVESSYRYYAVSESGAIGPMQVKPKFWNDKCDNLSSPESNIMCGAMIFSLYKFKYCNNDEKCAFQTYNVGPTNFKNKSFSDSKERYYKKIVDLKSKFIKYDTDNILALM